MEGGVGVKKEQGMDDDDEDIIPLAKSRRRVTVKKEVGVEGGGMGKEHLSLDAQLLSWEMGMNPGFEKSDVFAACA